MGFSSPSLFSKQSVVCTAFAAGAFLFAPQTVFSQEEATLEPIVITADRFGVEADKLGSATTIITREQIENSGTAYVPDLLRSVPGLAVNRTGGFGGMTQIRIRGAEGNHVLVVVDGIEVNNPSEGEFDFSNLLAADIERIEVLRGPQSATWGSDALAGVINIVTRKAGKGVSISAKAEAGSFNSKLFSGRIAAGSDTARAAVTLTRQDTEGFNISDFGNEDDGDENTTVSATGDIDLGGHLNVSGALRYYRRRSQSDDQDFGFGALQGQLVDSDDETKREELFAKAQVRLNLFNDRWVQKAFVTTVDTELDGFSDDVLSFGDRTERLKYGYESVIKFDTPSLANANHTLIGLVETETEKFQNISPFALPGKPTFERDIQSVVGEYRLGLWDSLFLTGAYRYDDNDQFEDAETYRVTAAYKLAATGTRFHGSYGKGVKNPTFFEQFGSNDTFVGNPDLEPETSIGWDAGIEQRLFNDRLIVDVTYFKADLENEIFGTFATVVNLDDDSERQGVEVTVQARPSDNLDVSAAYTYTDSEQIRAGVATQEVRRPEHTASFNATYRFLDNRARVSAGVIYNGDMLDTDFTRPGPGFSFPLSVIDSYTLVHLSGSYDISENIRWFGRIENLFDEDYEEILGFNTAGVAAYTGLRVKIGD